MVIQYIMILLMDRLHNIFMSGGVNMGFTNVHDVLIMDDKENIYSFYIHENKIKMILYDKNTGKATKRVIIGDCIDEYDSAISEDGIVYLVCQKLDGSIMLVSIDGYNQEEYFLAEKFDSRLRDINVKLIGNQIHIIYCLESNEGNNRFRIYHHRLKNNEWDTNVVSDITIREILNPISIIKLEDDMVIGYYDLVDNTEQVFINIYSIVNSKWSDKIQVTTDRSTKMYLDMLNCNANEINLCYSKFLEGNFIVTYEKYRMSNGEATKVVEHTLSNPANCMYPTFIYSDGTLWTIWIEYNGLLSCFSEDGGLSWSLPYSWEESKRADFARYKFTTNNDAIKDAYDFNYGFATYGESTTFIGFGDVEAAIEVPLKSQIKKKEDEDEDIENDVDNEGIMLEKEVSRIQENIVKEKEVDESIELNEIRERVEIIEQALKAITEILETKLSEINFQSQYEHENSKKITELEKRVFDIESFLSKRRGPLRR